VHGEKDLAGRIVTVPADTTSFDFVQSQKAKGLAIKEVKAYRLTADVFMAVKAGHADAIVVDEPVARYFVKQDPETFVLSGRAMAPEPIGIGVRKTAPDLRDAVAKAVDDMRRDGTMKTLAMKWFGGELGA
jgi:polar amino acid transport system substrate-binding protein